MAMPAHRNPLSLAAILVALALCAPAVSAPSSVSFSTGCGGGGGAAGGGGGGGAITSNQAALATYSVRNNSQYDIHYIYISPTSQSTWGPDQLDSDQILRAGQSLTLTGVTCDNYDLKLVDEDGDECIQSNVEICHNTTLYIENEALLECEGYR
jgi:hypothetical protein